MAGRPRPPPATDDPAGSTGAYAPAQVEARVAELVTLARDHGLRGGTWHARHDLRGRAAGQARPADGELRFNPLLGAANWEHFLQHTVAHEVAHLVAWWTWGRRTLGHGPRWQQVMALFGSPAERCHPYDVSTSSAWQQRRWDYRCACPTLHRLTTTRHRRVERGQAEYRCRCCGEVLLPAG